MTWMLSQLIRKNRRTNRQATTTKKVVQNEFVQVPTGTSVQMPKEPTPEPSPANTDGPSPIDNYELSLNRDVDLVNPCELSPDHNFDPVGTCEHSPDQFTPEFSSDHNSKRFHTLAQSPEEFTHASSPPA